MSIYFFKDVYWGYRVYYKVEIIFVDIEILLVVEEFKVKIDVFKLIDMFILNVIILLDKKEGLDCVFLRGYV